jgi:quinol monooxygenase YgiN
LRISILSRTILQKPLNNKVVVTPELGAAKHGCIKATIFQKIENRNSILSLTDWNDANSARNFFKSQQYNSFANKLHISPHVDREILSFKGNRKYSDIKSKLFSIERIYVNDYDDYLNAALKIYTPEIAAQLGILGINLFTLEGNDKILVVLVNWESEQAMFSFTQIDPGAGLTELGSRTDRYGLMILAEKWIQNS